MIIVADCKWTSLSIKNTRLIEKVFRYFDFEKTQEALKVLKDNETVL